MTEQRRSLRDRLRDRAAIGFADGMSTPRPAAHEEPLGELCPPLELEDAPGHLPPRRAPGEGPGVFDPDPGVGRAPGGWSGPGLAPGARAVSGGPGATQPVRPEPTSRPRAGLAPRLGDPIDGAHRDRIDRLRGMLDAMIARQHAGLRAPAAVDPPTEHAQTQLRNPSPTRLAMLQGPLPGARVDSPHGPIHRVHRLLEPDHAHGRVPVAPARTVQASTLAALCLDPSLAGLDASRFLYLDTETTGLSGGTGTLPFLLGLARFEDGVLAVEQLLLRSPADEPVMLKLLTDRLAEASAIVTYNGKSYDWPLLRSRYVMNRLPAPEPPAHVDLLHAARRIVKARLGEVRLIHLEQDLLQFRREYDIEGREIPTVYWASVRGWDASLLTPIVEHNFHDLVALAAILSTLVDRFENLRAADDPRDHLGFARVAARADDHPRATEFAEAAAVGGGAASVVVAARTLAARLAGRRGDPSEAERQLLSGLATLPASSPAARDLHLSLAKLYEHRLKRPEAALEHALAGVGVEPEADHARRLDRLRQRVEKRRKPPRTASSKLTHPS